MESASGILSISGFSAWPRGGAEARVMAPDVDVDGARLQKLVEENLGWLRGWLKGRIADPHLVDDLCQESFLKALRRFRKLRDPLRFPAWLYRIAENTVRDHLRRESRRRAHVQYTDRLEDIEIPAPPRDDLGRSEDAERLLSDIRSLSPRFRDPLLLRHSQGLSYREIGGILGISENAVQVRIFRARQKLRAKQKQRE